MYRTLLADGGTPSRAAAFYGVTFAGDTPPASVAVASRTPRVDVARVDVARVDAAEDLAGSDLARSGVTRWRRTRHALVCEVDGTLVQVPCGVRE